MGPASWPPVNSNEPSLESPSAPETLCQIMVPYADFNLLRFPDRDRAMAKIRDRRSCRISFRLVTTAPSRLASPAAQQHIWPVPGPLVWPARPRGCYSGLPPWLSAT
jgi:hypothetical protein